MDDLDLGATIKGFIAGQKLFNRYTLTRILGRGGMGVVWLTRDEVLGRDTALKFLPEIIAADRDAIEDLKREVRRAIDLAHPHIVKIHDFVTDGRTAAVSMEYVTGHTLAALRHDEPGKLLPLARLSPWVAQLCSALDYAHGMAQVVHRDLKPANLMVDARGYLKVLDFGIAASVSDSVSRVSQQAGSSGTPVYMSPQQMMGEKPAVTDDIYALGATLYDLLAGKPPFASGNIMLQVLNKPAPPLAEKRAELGLSGEPIPPEWAETIMACLAKEPKDRPQTAGEVAERLGLTTKSTKVTKAEPVVGPDLRAGREEVKAVGASLADAREGARARSSRAPTMLALAAGVVLLAAAGWYFGLHVPEQRRIETERLRVEQARLETERQQAESVRIQTERETEARRIEAARLAGEQQAERQRVEAERARLAAEQQAERQRLEAEQARLAAARGGLVIRTSPAGAEVRVGAVALDKSPLTLKDQKLGKYPVRIRLDGYEEWTGEVEVKENDFTDLDIALIRSTGRVALTGTAGADVTSGGTRLGKLPLTLERVPTGGVKYTVSLKGYKPTEVTGEVVRNAELRLSATLEPQLYPQPGQSYENTLGMKFVPVPGTNVLFSIWETRVQDFEAFVRETGHDATQGMYSDRGDGWKQQGDTWRSPGFPQGPTHPVVGVNQADAKAFCEWLTKRERAAGRLEANQSYRLPTDAEWDAAVGRAEFPWGNQWPPPRGAGNYADEAAKRGRYKSWSIINGYDDGYDATAPVGSFTANTHGIYDLGGNVWEYVDDRAHGLRGASFNNFVRGYLASSNRSTNDYRDYNFGFRVVCAVGSVR